MVYLFLDLKCVGCYYIIDKSKISQNLLLIASIYFTITSSAKNLDDNNVELYTN